MLADLERRAELVKAKVITAAADAVSDHQDVPLAEHFDAYLIKLEAEGTSPDHSRCQVDQKQSQHLQVRRALTASPRVRLGQSLGQLLTTLVPQSHSLA